MKPLALIEKAVKGPIWGCQMCGQCVLHSTGMTCPMNCPKTLRNGPCGGVRANGHCEVKPEMRCVWVKAYDRADKLPVWGEHIHDLRPLLAETGAASTGTFLMGTVKGDVHDIGKNLCNIMLEGAGFTVIDLGVNVPPEKFVEEIESNKPDIVGFSAFLTTTMPMFKANINALEKAGIRDDVIVMVGGAPVTQEYADAVGADGYAADASATVKRAKALLKDRRAKVPA